MPANVETMFSVRETPWHGLGRIIMDAPARRAALQMLFQQRFLPVGKLVVQLGADPFQRLIAGEHAGRLLSDEMKCAPCLYRYPLDERPGEKFPVESR